MAKKNERRVCLYPGCVGEPRNQLGLRVRNKPGPDSMWTHDTAAYLCDEHAGMGLTFVIDVSLNSNGKKIYSSVSHQDGEHFDRESDINPRPKTPAV